MKTSGQAGPAEPCGRAVRAVEWRGDEEFGHVGVRHLHVDDASGQDAKQHVHRPVEVLEEATDVVLDGLRRLVRRRVDQPEDSAEL